MSDMLNKFCDVHHLYDDCWRRESGSQEDAGQSANYAQLLPGGLCFAHGKYPGMQCPEFPKCATDPQKPEYLAMAGNWSAPSPVGTALQYGQLRSLEMYYAQKDDCKHHGGCGKLCVDCVADELTRLRTQLDQARRERDEEMMSFAQRYDNSVQFLQSQSQTYCERVIAAESKVAELQAELSQVRAAFQKFHENLPDGEYVGLGELRMAMKWKSVASSEQTREHKQ